MRLDLILDTSKLALLERAFAAIPDLTRATLLRFMHGATQHLQGEVVERTPAAEGVLRGSIIAGVRELPGEILGVVGTSLAYAEAVELGTKPHMPPIAPLEQWVRTKLGLRDKAAKSAARGIQWKIYHHGTKGKFMFRNTVAANKGQVERQYARTIAGLGAALERHLAGGDGA